MSPPLSVGDIVNAADRAFGKGWQIDEELKSFVRQAASRFVDQLGRLQASVSVKQSRARQYHVLRSLDARYCCLLLGWPKNGWKQMTPEEIMAIALALNARRDCGEPIRAYWKTKPVGGRWISIFGPKRRALQRLAKEVLDATAGVSPYDFCRRGRGSNRALLAMRSVAEKEGGRWFHTSDVRDCYGSFDGREIASLIPLPKAVVENCILIPEGAEVLIQDGLEQQASEQAVRRGIPQGSLASPAVAAFLLRPVLDKLSGKLVICHGDDIVTVTRTLKECETNKDVLALALLEHPAGPLIMKTNEVARLGQPIDVLGYRIRRRWKMYGGGVRFVPSPASFKKFYKRAERELLVELKWPCDVAAAAMAKVPNWQSGLILWDTSPAGDQIVEIRMMDDVVSCVKTKLMKAAGAGIYKKHLSA